jgi:hypothetical protein
MRYRPISHDELTRWRWAVLDVDAKCAGQRTTTATGAAIEIDN